MANWTLEVSRCVICPCYTRDVNYSSFEIKSNEICLRESSSENLTQLQALLGGLERSCEPGVIELDVAKAQISPEIVLLALLDRLLEVHLGDRVFLEDCQPVAPFSINDAVPEEQGAFVGLRPHHLPTNFLDEWKTRGEV